MTVADKREFDEAFGTRDRKIAKEQGIDEGKDGDIRANAQSKRKDCDRGEAGIFAQGAEGVTDILPELVHGGSPQRLRRIKGRFQAKIGAVTEGRPYKTGL